MAPLRFLCFPLIPSVSLSSPLPPLSPPLSLNSPRLCPPLSLALPSPSSYSLPSLPLPSLPSSSSSSSSPLPSPPSPLPPSLTSLPPFTLLYLPPAPFHSPLSDVDPDDDNEQWFKAACYRCLIYMGDAGMRSVVFGPAVMSPSKGKKTTSTASLPNYIAPFLVHPLWYPQRSWVSLGRYGGMKSSCPQNTKWLPLGNRFQSRDSLDSLYVNPTIDTPT